MMTPAQIEQLFIENTNELNKLNIASGSMIKALIQGIASNGNIYIRLTNATEGGHKVSYTYIEGEQSKIAKVAKALGLIVTNTTLEARHA